jgi:small conductance mechanosensitive channel
LAAREEHKKSAYIIMFGSILNVILILAAGSGILVLVGFDFGRIITMTEVTTFLKNQIGRIIASVVLIIVSFGVVNVVKVALFRFARREGPFKKRRQTIYKILMSFTKYSIYLIDIAILLGIWGINVTPILAGLGIAGLVVGLGAQRLITDFINGLFIVFEHHFDVGDIVQIGDFKGEVIDIGLKTTKIKNWKNEVRIIANGNINEVTNFSLDNSVAYIEFKLDYAVDVEEAIDILQKKLPEAVSSLPQVLEAPIVRGVMNMGDNNITIGVMCLAKTENHYVVERTIRLKVKEILEAAGIQTALTQTVVVEGKSNGV